MALQAYLDIDLKPNSETAFDLLARLPHEVELDAINLTGDGDPGAASANLTPEMSGWLGSHVLQSRQTALASLRSRAASVRGGGGIEGIVEELEADELKRTKNINRAAETKTFYDQHGRELDKLVKIEREYEEMREIEGNRDAKLPSKFIDILVPLIIMIPESLINYDSFLKLWKIPAVAAGLTVVVGFGIGISAYMTGKFIKGWAHYLPPYDPAQRNKGFRYIGIAIVVLMIALGAVSYARYRTVTEMIDVALSLGLPPPNLAALMFGLIAGNLLVFGIGVGATYLLHDENPMYADKTDAMQTQRTKVEKLRAKLLLPKLKQIDQAYSQNIKTMQRRAKLMESQPDYGPVSADLGKIRAKDEQVIALLHNYRTRLRGLISQSRPDFTFGGPADVRLSGQSGTRVSLAEFGAASISLYLC
jgi:hypothetical protein